MSCTHAVILIRPESGGSKTPMMLQEVLFKPLLRWMSDALYVAGVRSVRVVRADASLDERLLTCLTPHLRDVVLWDADTSELGREVRSFLTGASGEALFITAPVLPTGRAVASLADAAGGTLLTELLSDDGLPTGAYCFSRADAGILFSHVDSRFDLREACRPLNAECCGHRPPDGGGTTRIQSLTELNIARRALQAAVVERHMHQGVIIPDPSSVTISAEAVIGRDTTLLPGVIIRGETVIGEDCEIGPFTLLSDSTVGDRCSINASQVYDSQMGSDVKMGPYAYVRPHCSLGSRIKVGDFVELKNARIGSGTKIPHLSYVGDADVGEGVNIGCGAITVNYNGREKHRTVIEDGAFIGCNSNLVAPVTVGQNAYTAAGSTLTRDVPPDALGIARARQENKEGWVSKRRG